jgi:membrane protein YdbS with pleckstrin-like domain
MGADTENCLEPQPDVAVLKPRTTTIRTAIRYQTVDARIRPNMSFVNLQIPLESLPQFSVVEFQRLHPLYARVTLGVALGFEIPVLAVATFVLFLGIVPSGGLGAPAAVLICGAIVAGMALLAWFVHRAASVIRYAVRQHDVIVRSGVFWKKETVQPIKRIQHVEQHQGPIDKRVGLYQLNLFSAGTGHFTLRIPGLDAGAAARIKQFLLTADG